MNIQLSEHFTYSKLLRFTLPTIVMMIFTSIYSVVDGIFVSNFVGKTLCRSQSHFSLCHDFRLRWLYDRHRRQRHCIQNHGRRRQ